MIYIYFIEFFEEFINRRHTGHTTLLSDGMKNYDRQFIVVCVDSDHKKRLMEKVNNKNAVFVTYKNFRKNVIGRRDCPIVMDNYTLNIVFQDVITGVKDYEEFMERLRKKDLAITKKIQLDLINEKYHAKKIADEYIYSVEHIGWWKRLFSYKKILKERKDIYKANVNKFESND